MSAGATANRWERPRRPLPTATPANYQPIGEHSDDPGQILDLESDSSSGPSHTTHARDLDDDTDDEALARALADDSDAEAPHPDITASSSAPAGSEEDLMAEEEARIIADEEERLRRKRKRPYRQRSHEEDAARNSPSLLERHTSRARGRIARSRSASSSSPDVSARTGTVTKDDETHAEPHTGHPTTLSPDTLRALVLSNSGSILGNEIFEAQPGFHTDSEPSFTDFFDSGTDDDDRDGDDERDGDQTLLPPPAMPLTGTSIAPLASNEHDASDLDALTTDTDDSDAGSDLSALEAALLDIAARASREMEMAEKNDEQEMVPVEAGSAVATDLAAAEEAARQAEMPLLIIEDLDGRLIYARASNGEAVFGSDGEFEYIGEDGSSDEWSEDLSPDEELYAGVDFDGDDLDTDDEAALAQHAQQRLLLPSSTTANPDDTLQGNAEEFAQTQDALRDERQKLLLQRRRSSAAFPEEPPSDDKYSTWSPSDEAKLLEALTEGPPQISRTATDNSNAASAAGSNAGISTLVAMPDLNHQTLDLARQLEMEMNDDEGETTDEMAEEDMQFSRLLVGSVEPHGHLDRQKRKQQRRERREQLRLRRRQIKRRGRSRDLKPLPSGPLGSSGPPHPAMLSDLGSTATATTMETMSTTDPMLPAALHHASAPSSITTAAQTSTHHGDTDPPTSTHAAFDPSVAQDLPTTTKEASDATLSALANANAHSSAPEEASTLATAPVPVATISSFSEAPLAPATLPAIASESVGPATVPAISETKAVTADSTPAPEPLVTSENVPTVSEGAHVASGPVHPTFEPASALQDTTSASTETDNGEEGSTSLPKSQDVPINNPATTEVAPLSNQVADAVQSGSGNGSVAVPANASIPASVPQVWGESHEPPWMAEALAQALANSPNLTIHTTPLRPPMMGSFRPTSSNSKHRAVIDGRTEAPSPFSVNSTVRNKGLGIRAAQTSAKRNRAREMETPSQPSKRHRRLSAGPTSTGHSRSRSAASRPPAGPISETVTSPEATGEEDPDHMELIDLDLDDVLDASALRMAGSSSPPRDDTNTKPLSGLNSSKLASPALINMSNVSPSSSRERGAPQSQLGFNTQAFARWNRVPMNTFRDGQRQPPRPTSASATRFGAGALDNLGLVMMPPSSSRGDQINPTAPGNSHSPSHEAGSPARSDVDQLYPRGPPSDLQSDTTSRKVTRREKRARQAQRQAMRHQALGALPPQPQGTGSGSPPGYTGQSVPVSPIPGSEASLAPTPGEPASKNSAPPASDANRANHSLLAHSGPMQGPPSSSMHGVLHSPLFSGLNFADEELDEGTGGPLMI